jgi:hypothetical protein
MKTLYVYSGMGDDLILREREANPLTSYRLIGTFEIQEPVKKWVPRIIMPQITILSDSIEVRSTAVPRDAKNIRITYNELEEPAPVKKWAKKELHIERLGYNKDSEYRLIPSRPLPPNAANVKVVYEVLEEE